MTLTPFGEAIALLKELHFAGDDGELGKRVEAFLSVHSPHGRQRPNEAEGKDAYRLKHVYAEIIKKEPLPGAFRMTFEQWLEAIDAAMSSQSAPEEKE